MANATYKTNQSAVVQELLMRANAILGYPKTGIAANGATHVGGGIHADDSQVVTDALTDISVDSTNGDTFLLVTDTFRTTIDTVKAAAQARINGGTAISFDAEIVALSEQAEAYGDSAQKVFNPRQIPNCEVWARADTGVTSSGGAVSAWNAYTASNGAVPLVQATGARKPTLLSADTNGRSVLSFDGGDWLDIAGAQIPQPSTVYIVVKAADQLGDKTVLVTGDDAVRLRFSLDRWETYAGQTISVGPVNGMCVFETVFNNTHSLVGVNGGGPNEVVLGANSGSSGVRIGAANDGAAGLTGRVCEFILYNRVLSSLERTTIRTALSAQYGIKGVK